MNHYERLKVSRDAPPEVIRAAYRALANKLHPDRAGGAPTGPDDAQHAQMAALNTAYETLMDPKARQAYDDSIRMASGAASANASAQAASRSASRPWSRATASAGASAGASGGPATQFGADDDERSGPNTRIDMDWLTPRTAGPQALWPPSRRVTVLGGGLGAVVVLALVVWMWQMWGQHQTEQALSKQYAAQPGGAPLTAELPRLPVPGVSPAAAPTAAAPIEPRRPTVDELARMSDEELLQVLPTLDETAPRPAARAAVAPAAAARPHPLDGGPPLALRADQDLVDPLAP